MRSNSILILGLHHKRLHTHTNPQYLCHPLRVFLYPAAAAANRKSSGLIQEKYITFLQSIDFSHYQSMMIQLWTPKRRSSSKVAVLTVSEQPLAIGELYEGLCRYRYSCISQNVERSKKDFAKYCGLGEDWNYQAVPIFERGNAEKRQYVGVLEILSYCPQYSKFLYFSATLEIRDNVLESTLVEDVLEKPKVDKVFSVPDTLGSYGFIIVLRKMRRKQRKEVNINQSSAGRPKMHASLQGIQCTYSHLLESYKVKPTVQTPLTYGTICYALFRRSTSAVALIKGAERTTCNVCNVLTSITKDMLEFVRSEFGLPLIQIWAPCFCNTEIGAWMMLFCKQGSIDRSMGDAAIYDNVIVNQRPHCVQGGKGLVGKAYSQMKCYFSGDTRQISTSDYPLVAMTNLYNLTACFAIPFQTIHPDFEPIVLETFLPPSYDHRNLQALLKSILSSVAQMLSQLNVGFQLSEDEEFHVEKQAQEDEEKFVFFDVTKRTVATFGSIENEHLNQNTAESWFDLITDFAADDLSIYKTLEGSAHSQIIPSNGVGYDEVAEQNVDKEARSTSGMMKSKEVDRSISIPTSAARDDEIEECFNMTVKATYKGKTEMFPWDTASLGIEELHRELGKRFKLEVGSFDIQYKHGDGDWITLFSIEDLRCHVDTLKASDQSTLILEINPVEEAKLTLEKINQYRGSTTQKEAAKELNVSLSTLKRRCRELRLGRWPFSKRKKVHGLHSSAELNKTEVIQESAIRQCSNADAVENEGVSANGNCIETENDETASHDNEAAVANSTPMGTNGNVLATGNDEIGHCVTNNTRNSVAAAANSVPMGDIGEAVATGSDIITVIATYNGDNALFPLCCNSGFEELRKELDATFKFGAEKFKIKYKYDDGRWITLFRDKDLRFHIDTLKASGQSTMELSVFTDSL